MGPRRRRGHRTESYPLSVVYRATPQRAPTSSRWGRNRNTKSPHCLPFKDPFGSLLVFLHAAERFFPREFSKSQEKYGLVDLHS